MIKILVVNGPNLDMLGKREPEIYGNMTLKEINEKIEKHGKNILGKEIRFEFFQSNHEGEIVEKINKAKSDFIIINAAAFTHTSIAIRDAILSCGIPTIEVHISNIYKREEFRRKSLLSDVCLGLICGFGINSYLLAVYAAIEMAKEKGLV